MTIKQQLHPRNRHNKGYDFTALCEVYPALKPFVFTNKFGNLSIDFSSDQAVLALNAALLKNDYDIDHWVIPKGYLCPPIPGRVDYIHYLADLLKETNNNKPVFNGKVTALDIGTGASCIYPILACKTYGWSMLASDIDPVSIESAEKIIAANDSLSKYIQCRLQTSAENALHNIIKPHEKFDITICNPPFHSSLEQGLAGTQRKWNNLKNKKDKQANTALNFGGQNAELWCQGGELAFIRNLIKESRFYSQQVLWFTSLVSKHDHVSKLKLALKKVKANEVKVIKMSQGNKISRFLAWTFLTPEEREQWCQDRF
ncbi:23S rRNA (adenine(1618)-N(6))-methyltransferase RlmF [Bermanella sp. R86510]|uniref:23S rRNA (adenine(1618)-N(6))-methyltransferase RlmF n=1 Tax=unclassified Bermanella TaxID=2627862 RepID=UPI0037CB1980